MIGEKRIFVLLALILGIIAAALILSAATRGSSLDVLGLLVGLGVLYGSYLIFPREDEPAHGLGEDADGSGDQLGPRCRDLGHPRRRRWNRFNPRDRQRRARPVGLIVRAEMKADS